MGGGLHFSVEIELKMAKMPAFTNLKQWPRGHISALCRTIYPNTVCKKSNKEVHLLGEVYLQNLQVNVTWLMRMMSVCVTCDIV